METTIKIGWLFSNMFNLHGERGNILAIEAEAIRRGYAVETHQISLDTADFNPLDYDFLFCPSGEIAYFESAIDFLKPHSKALACFMETRPLLVTGTAVGLFGEVIHRDDKSRITGLGMIKIETNENHVVYGDDLHYTCEYGGAEMEIIGSQIQMVDIDIKEETPFGQLTYGYGNNGKTKFEGVRYGEGIFTNTLGPLLVCNPWLTEAILNVMERNKGLPFWEIRRDNALEIKSLKSKRAFIEKKESHLMKITER